MVNISIVMPMYNAEMYLAETLKSISNQTYSEYELICVNDASTDDTLDILHQFQFTDDRIIILQNEVRMGAAESRNKGMYHARGKYITFLDADDIFDEEMLRLAYECAESQKVDIVMYEYEHVASEVIYEKRCVMRSQRFVEKYCTNPFSVCDYNAIEYMKWANSPCNKMYKKDFVLTHKLEFQTLSSSNDVYFVRMALLLADKIIMLNDRRVMVYARDHLVPTRISFNRDPYCAYLAMKKIGEELVARNLLSKKYEYYYCLAYFTLSATVIRTKDIHIAKTFYDFVGKEGIRTLISLDEECYKKTNIFIQDSLERFITHSFESGWFRERDIWGAYLDREKEKLNALIQTYGKEKRDVFIWGAGIRGKKLLRFLNGNHISIEGIVDRDEKKQGTDCEGYIIQNPENVKNKVGVYLFTSDIIFEEMHKKIKKLGIDVINVNELVGNL